MPEQQPQYVYITEWYGHWDHIPLVERYVLVEMRSTGAKVRLYGHEKFIRGCSSRAFHYSLEDLKVWFDRWFKRAREINSAALKRIDEAEAAGIRFHEKPSEPVVLPKEVEL